MEDVIPIHMSQILRDAGHGKFERKDVIEKEKEILHTIGFNLQFSTIFEEAYIALKTLLLGFKTQKLAKDSQQLLFQVTTFLGYLTVHTISTITVFSIRDIALAIAYFSLKYLKYEMKIKFEQQMTSTKNQGLNTH